MAKDRCRSLSAEESKKEMVKVGMYNVAGFSNKFSRFFSDDFFCCRSPKSIAVVVERGNRNTLQWCRIKCKDSPYRYGKCNMEITKSKQDIRTCDQITIPMMHKLKWRARKHAARAEGASARRTVNKLLTIDAEPSASTLARWTKAGWQGSFQCWG